MNKIRIGIICPSEIAFRRFMPALGKVNGMEYMGVAIANEREPYKRRERLERGRQNDGKII